MLLLPLTILNVLVVIAFGLIIISFHEFGSSSIIGITANTLEKRIGNDIDAISVANFPPWGYDPKANHVVKYSLLS